MFGLYTAVALAIAALVVGLSPAVEAPRGRTPRATTGWRRLVPPLGPSRGNVLRLAGLFSVDALLAGLMVRSLLVLFFHLRYGVPLAVLFFATSLLSVWLVLFTIEMRATVDTKGCHRDQRSPILRPLVISSWIDPTR